MGQPCEEQPNTSRPSSSKSSETDWHNILMNDLAVSPSDDDTPTLVTTATNTDRQQNPCTSSTMYTSPVCIMDLEPGTSQALLTTHGVDSEAKEFIKIAPRTTTQIGCVPLIRIKDGETQTETSKVCNNCSHEEHLILQRMAYIQADAYRNVRQNFVEPITSREDRSKMRLQNKSAYNKWIQKFQSETKPETS